MAAPLGALPPATPSTLCVAIPASIGAAFKALKQRRAAAWIVYKITEGFELEEAARGAPSATAVADLLRALPPADGRYFVFDLATKNSYGGSGSRLLFFTWAPSSAGRANVVYAAQRRALDATFAGVIDAHAATREDVEAALLPPAAGGGGGGDEWDPDA